MTPFPYHNGGDRAGLCAGSMLKFAFLLLFLLATMTCPGSGIFAKALAQSDNPATPSLTINAYFAHWSYGLAGITGQVQNPYQGDSGQHLQVYDPDDKLVLEEDLSFNIGDNQKRASFGNYFFNIERKYVYDSYTVVATYGDQMTTKTTPPFSSEFQQPPDMSIESLKENDDGSVGIRGHVWGGMVMEQLDFSIYSSDDTLLTIVTTELSLHAQFSATVNAEDASQIFTENGDYTIVGNLVGTDAPQVETTLACTMPDYATRSFLEVAALDTINSELEVMFSVFQNGKLVDGGIFIGREQDNIHIGGYADSCSI